MTTSDELRLYLSSPPEEVLHPLRWWYEKRLLYPRLHRMALDYLSIPGLFRVLLLRFYCCLLIVISLAQQRLLKSSGSSVAEGWFSPILVAASLSGPLARCYV
jgi:hypothetical protein